MFLLRNLAELSTVWRMPSAHSGIEIDGARLRELRKMNGDTLVSFAPKCGLSDAYLSDLETGRRPRVSPPAFVRICDALGLADRHALVRRPRRKREAA